MYYLFLGENTSKKNKTIVWDGECKEAFRKLKEICTSIPILAYANFSKPLKLHTDACTLGFGAILYENWNGVDCIIGYASRSLNKMDIQKHFRNYLFHGLCKQLCDSVCYLYDDPRIMYSQLVTAAHKAESEQKD